MVDEFAVNGTKTPVGRRMFLGLLALGAAGVAFGASVQNFVGNKLGSGLASLLPGGDHFRIYSITGTYPSISTTKYRLKVSGLVDQPMTLSYADLQALPSIEIVKAFQCVTGWRVPNVHWKGVPLSHILQMVGAHSGAVAVSFDSYDGADTESLSIDQAHLADVIVAYEMYGYKSLKWLSGIRVMDEQLVGYWEQNGYPVNGWLDGSTGLTNPSPNLS